MSASRFKSPLFWLAVVALLVVGGGLYGVWRFFAPLPIPPKEPWLEQWVALAESHQRPGENAFPLYFKAGELAEDIRAQTQRAEFGNGNAVMVLTCGEHMFDEVEKWASTPYGTAVPPLNLVVNRKRHSALSVSRQDLWQQYRMRFAHQLTFRRATLALLHAAIHRTETGEWPERLEDAAPAPLHIDVATGQPFLYELKPDGMQFRLPGTAQEYHRLYGRRTTSGPWLEALSDLVPERRSLEEEAWYLGGIGQRPDVNLDWSVPEEFR